MIISDEGYVKVKGKPNEILADLETATARVYLNLKKKYGQRVAEDLINACFNMTLDYVDGIERG